jgi:L-ascorbate metabolism protein UlaG (beta-lactamase superfamily)
LRRVDAARAVPLGSTFGPLQVEPVETPHASVEHYSYTVSWAGRRFYFVGDTDSTEALLAARNLDVAFVSPWLLNEVLRSGRTIDARRIVIYHQAPGESLPSCKTCTVLRQGESFIVP